MFLLWTQLNNEFVFYVFHFSFFFNLYIWRILFRMPKLHQSAIFRVYMYFVAAIRNMNLSSLPVFFWTISRTDFCFRGRLSRIIVLRWILPKMRESESLKSLFAGRTDILRWMIATIFQASVSAWRSSVVLTLGEKTRDCRVFGCWDRRTRSNGESIVRV